ncbi:MAG: septum site-determining protein MinC [Chloroflexi bacterium]|nr:septum site-determining protein MinC [Chloroflexota bacterium]
MQSSSSVIIKGVREGLLLILDDEVSFAQILTDLAERIKGQPSFFSGAVVILNAGRRVIDNPEFGVLYNMLTRNGMKVQSLVSLSAQSRLVAEGFGVNSRPPSFAAGDAGVSLGLRDRGIPTIITNEVLEGGVTEVGSGLFLRCNLRPGQSVRFAGDVCVLGDIETGAEIIADGDVVIWGSLKGLVHAGVSGDDEAVVCALQMSPMQLSIAGVVSRFPGHTTGYLDRPQPPELARLDAGHIVVEAWSGTDGITNHEL